MWHLPLFSHLRKVRSYYPLIAFIFMIALGGGIAFGGSLFSSSIAHAYTSTPYAGCSDSSVTPPDAKSLLIVLLDRSGSLGFNEVGTGTDPYNYSASVTDALSDLWPGPMAVVAFPSTNGDTLLIGPNSPGQREPLKERVASLPSQGYTPLEAAMKMAQNLLSQQTFPQGSRIVLITDGMPQTAADPNGNQQEQDILGTLAPTFCQEGVSISPFGLTIPENSNPAKFLQQVAMETGGKYQLVSNSAQLAGAVLGLYAAWDNLSFNRVDRDQVHGYYPIVTDSSVQSAYILTFYQSGQNEPLVTDAGQQVAYTQSTDNRHYEIDTLDTPIPPGTYTVRTADPNAVVYVLDQSTRQLQLIPPVTSSVVAPGQTLSIQVHLVDQGKGAYIPSSSEEVFFKAVVTETIHGRTTSYNLPLTHQAGSDLFTGTFVLPRDAAPGAEAVPIGTLDIMVTGTDRGVRYTVNSQEMRVVIPMYIPPPCYSWSCASLSVHALSISALALLVLLVILLILYLIWRGQPEIYGLLVPAERSDGGMEGGRGGRRNRNEGVTLDERKRTWRNRLFHRSIITSDELRALSRGKLTFNLARLEFIARPTRLDEKKKGEKKKNVMHMQLAKDNQINDVGIENGSDVSTVVSGKPVPLTRGTVIIVNGKRQATYY